MTFLFLKLLKTHPIKKINPSYTPKINNYGNLVAACRKCNCKKSARTPEEFFQKHPEYEQNFIRNSRYISDRVLSALGLNR